MAQTCGHTHRSRPADTSWRQDNPQCRRSGEKGSRRRPAKYSPSSPAESEARPGPGSESEAGRARRSLEDLYQIAVVVRPKSHFGSWFGEMNGNSLGRRGKLPFTRGHYDPGGRGKIIGILIIIDRDRLLAKFLGQTGDHRR